MTITLLISIIGALTAVIVSLIGASLANRNSIVLQTRKLKEEHYISFIEAIHNLASDNNKPEYLIKYTFARDKLFLIASEEVIKQMLFYENEGVGKPCDLHDKYLTDLIKSIRKDLKLNDKNFPMIYLKKGKK
ncbi:MAG: hypothetical protein WCH34_08135 [Bacteroidota bacterium]